MPWKVEKQGKKFVVVKKSDGKVVATHGSKHKAMQQVAAMYANMKDEPHA